MGQALLCFLAEHKVIDDEGPVGPGKKFAQAGRDGQARHQR